ncbi:class I SAM-dependent methyltransferase [Peijinzhouia sedimentorum]
MAERATPDIKGFKKQYKIIWRRGFIPKLQIYPTPYSKAFYWRYEWAKDYCKGKDVLEIPCGMGWGTSLLKNANTIIGIDISNEAIQDAKSRYQNKTMKFEVGNMAQLPFNNDSFEVVVCLEGIEHVDIITGKKFISEAARVLKKGGLLLLSSPRHKTKEHSGNPYHLIEYKLEELIELLAPYFLINSIQRREVDDLNVYYIVAKHLTH